MVTGYKITVKNQDVMFVSDETDDDLIDLLTYDLIVEDDDVLTDVQAFAEIEAEIEAKTATIETDDEIHERAWDELVSHRDNTEDALRDLNAQYRKDPTPALKRQVRDTYLTLKDLNLQVEEGWNEIYIEAREEMREAIRSEISSLISKAVDRADFFMAKHFLHETYPDWTDDLIAFYDEACRNRWEDGYEDWRHDYYSSDNVFDYCLKSIIEDHHYERNREIEAEIERRYGSVGRTNAGISLS